MKISIKKILDDSWLIKLDHASITIDHFTCELLYMTLEHTLALKLGQTHSILDCYIKLALNLNRLDSQSLQKFIPKINQSDLIILLKAVDDDNLTRKVLSNVGGILGKQIRQDLSLSINNDDEQLIKISIRKIMETLFSLESKGEIQIISTETEYI